VFSFRVVTYNILADIYADSDFSRDYLFSHCPADILSIDYRKQLLLKELAGICHYMGYVIVILLWLGDCLKLLLCEPNCGC